MFVESDGTSYHLKYKKCGKSRCRKCQPGGPGHGPYWVSYQNGKEKYFGSHLPASLQQPGRLHQGTLVGREGELGQLHTVVESVEKHRGSDTTRRRRKSASYFTEQASTQIVLLTGEVGIGKTRLAEEMAHEVLQRGWIVLWGRSYEQEGVISYRIWIDVLQKALSLQPEYHTKEKQTLQQYEPLNTLLLELREFFPLTTVVEEREQVRLWEAAYSLLTTLSQKKPLLIVLDDLQWADESSTDLLAYLARRASSEAMIVLGTYRTASRSLDVLFSEMQREGHTLILPIYPLSREHIGKLVSSSALTEAQISSIQSRAEGNPFFAEELARDASTLKGEHLHPPMLGSLPSSITILLEQRLEGISTACRSLLRNGAVLGGSFKFSTVYEMEVLSGASPVSEATVLELLEEALHARILTEEGSGKNVNYRFWHPLLANLLYENLSAYRRASLHRRAADVLRSHSTDHEEENAAIITHHLLNGGADSQLIAHYAKMAGDRAYTLSAYGEAAKHYRTALEQSDEAGEQSMTEDRAVLSESLGECLRVQGEAQEARKYYEQAVAIHLTRYSNAESPEQEHIAQILALLYGDVGLTWFDTSDVEQAMHSYTRGEQILFEAGITGGYAWARILYEESYAKWREGNYDEAYRLAERTLTLFKESNTEQSQESKTFTGLNRMRRTLAGDAADIGRTHMLLGLIANGMGNTAEALRHLTAALAVFEYHNRQREIANVCCNLGDLYLRKADYLLAQNVLQRSLELAERIGDKPLASFVSGNLGLLDLRRGSLEKAEASFRRAILLAERTSSLAGAGLWSNYVSVAMQEQGKLEEAEAMAQQTLKILRPLRIAPYMGIALVTVGTLRAIPALLVSTPHPAEHPDTRLSHSLQRASKTLTHALSLQSLEAETRLEAQLLQARIALFLERRDEVVRLLAQIREDAERAELIWLIARAQCLQAEVCVQLGQREEAAHLFHEAIDTFHTHGLLLEYARTLYRYAETLMRPNDLIGLTARLDSTEWWLSLQKAKHIFLQCHASLDLQLIERILHDVENAHNPSK